MALPIILVNSATGSDTLASGAGPPVAVTGAGASTDVAGTTVTLAAGTNLAAVAVDGSAVIYLADTTAGHRRFSKITATAGSGGATPTVTVTPAFFASLTGKAFAIGGVRASIGGAASYVLFTNNGGNGDAQAGWIIEMQSGHVEPTVNFVFEVKVSGSPSAAVGPFILRGAAGAATYPQVPIGLQFIQRGQYVWLMDFDMPWRTGGDVVSCTNSNTRLQNLYISGGLYVNMGGACDSSLIGCHLSGGFGVDFGNSTGLGKNIEVIGNYIHGAGGNAVRMLDVISGMNFQHNVIVGNTGNGMTFRQDRGDQFGSCRISNNTISNNGGHGISYTGDADSTGALSVINNILSGNGGYGLKFENSQTLLNLLARGTVILGNNVYNNTSGAYLPAGIGLYDTTADPAFTNAAGGDYSIGAALKAQGYPGGARFVGRSSATRSYVDPGAAQRQEAGGGGNTYSRSRVVA